MNKLQKLNTNNKGKIGNFDYPLDKAYELIKIKTFHLQHFSKVGNNK